MVLLACINSSTDISIARRTTCGRGGVCFILNLVEDRIALSEHKKDPAFGRFPAQSDMLIQGFDSTNCCWLIF